MQNILTLSRNNSLIKNSILDAAGIAFLYFIPTISHLFSFPVYMFEPMRILMILAMVHSTKKNAYLLALTLPLFSFITASHPVLVKALLMTGEMTLNVFLFYLLCKKLPNYFYAAAASIIGAKVFYYAGKYLLIKASLLSMDLVDTPMFIQLGLTLIFSVYVLFLYGRKKAE